MQSHRISLKASASLQNWKETPAPQREALDANVAVDCGWGRLIFAHTFSDSRELTGTLCAEEAGTRDIAIYVRDPHVVLSLAPQELFLDPSHTFRFRLDQPHPSAETPKGFVVRRMLSEEDAEAITELYRSRGMVAPEAGFVWDRRNRRKLTYLVAEDEANGRILGTVMGIDHKEAFNDPENGTSLWCLAVDPQAPYPGVGQALVRQLCEHYTSRGREYLDLSVMHDNRQAIALYEKLGFVRAPVFTLKRKNPINEPLYTPSDPEVEQLNPYAEIIVKEAQRRGISVDVLSAEGGYFSLTFGGRTITCRESLSELTSAVAMSRCDSKRETSRMLAEAGLSVALQKKAGLAADNEAFLRRCGQVVVKPVSGEQGRGISVDLREPEEMAAAIERARNFGDEVLIEQYVDGDDLRVVVIDYRVVAAAVRQPAEVCGTGTHTVLDLIKAQSRRRQAATGGESAIPLDGETERCVRQAGYGMDSVLPRGERLQVRKTANLHTGGTMRDVTECLNPTLKEAAVRAARTLEIPVAGLDFLVPDVEGEEYVIIEANERPGLANHEPQPTAQRFVDLLFPQTVATPA